MKQINVAYFAWMFASWKQVKEGYKDFYAEQLDKLCEELPSGSGIDTGVMFDRVTSTKDCLRFAFSFHHMDEQGGYDGWSEHTLKIMPDLQEGFKIVIAGINRNGIKEYLYELFGSLFYHSVQDSRDIFRTESSLYRAAHNIPNT